MARRIDCGAWTAMAFQPCSLERSILGGGDSEERLLRKQTRRRCVRNCVESTLFVWCRLWRFSQRPKSTKRPNPVSADGSMPYGFLRLSTLDSHLQFLLRREQSDIDLITTRMLKWHYVGLYRPPLAFCVNHKYHCHAILQSSMDACYELFK